MLPRSIFCVLEKFQREHAQKYSGVNNPLSDVLRPRPVILFAFVEMRNISIYYEPFRDVFAIVYYSASPSRHPSDGFILPSWSRRPRWDRDLFHCMAMVCLLVSKLRRE